MRRDIQSLVDFLESNLDLTWRPFKTRALNHIAGFINARETDLHDLRRLLYRHDARRRVNGAYAKRYAGRRNSGVDDLHFHYEPIRGEPMIGVIMKTVINDTLPAIEEYDILDDDAQSEDESDA